MAIRRSTTSPRKRLLKPEESCGRQITASWFQRKKSWWPCGPAFDKFDSEIEEDLENHLRNVGLGYADIYLRLYMLGSEPAKASPIIMVCCSNSSVRDEAEGALRRSGILERYPEFGLGKAPLPLEQPTRAGALAGDVFMMDGDDNDSTCGYGDIAPPANWNGQLPTPNLTPSRHIDELLSTEAKPRLGRQIFLADNAGLPSRAATGGYIVQVDGEYYQIIPGHITDPADTSDALPDPLDFDSDDCQFDGDSDDEDFDQAIPGRDDIALRRASATPPAREMSWEESGTEDTQSTRLSSASSLLLSPIPPQSESGPTPTPTPTSPAPAPVATDRLVKAGEVEYQSNVIGEASLDYAFTHVPKPDPASLNMITIIDSAGTRELRLQNPIDIGKVERKIIAVTASGGVTHGLIIPGATYFRKSDHGNLQRLYFLQLEGVVVEGDCGSAVFDAETGALYGHIVRGCSGTGVAYIVAATEVFADLKACLDQEVVLAGMKSRQEVDDAVTPGDDVALSRAAVGITPEQFLLEAESTFDATGLKFSSVMGSPIHSSRDGPDISVVGPPMSRDTSAGDSGYCSVVYSTLKASSASMDVRHQREPSANRDEGYASFSPDPDSYESMPTYDPVLGVFQPADPLTQAQASDRTAMHVTLPSLSEYGVMARDRWGPTLPSASSDPTLWQPYRPYPGSPATSNAYPLAPLVSEAPLAFPSFPPLVEPSDMYLDYAVPSEFTTAQSLPSIDNLLTPASRGYPITSAPAALTAGGDEYSHKERCPHPDCGKVFKDLKAHMLTHQSERPEKCPVVSCEFHTKGFARKYDKNRHTLTHYKGTLVCDFCSGAGTSAEKAFNRADVFKRHLTSVHGVGPTPPTSRRRGSVAKTTSAGGSGFGRCSTCRQIFRDAQELYEHLDDCVLRVVQQGDEPLAALTTRFQATAEDEDEDEIQQTLQNHSIPAETSDVSISEQDKDVDFTPKSRARREPSAVVSKRNRAKATSRPVIIIDERPSPHRAREKTAASSSLGRPPMPPRSRATVGILPPSNVINRRGEGMSEQEMRDALSEYVVYRFEKVKDDVEYDEDGRKSGSSWEHCRRTPLTQISRQEAIRQIARLSSRDPDVVGKKNALTADQQRHIERAMADLEKENRDFQITLTQLDSLWKAVEPRSPRFKVLAAKNKSQQLGSRTMRQRISITAYYKRSPRPEANVFSIYEEREGSQRASSATPASPPPAPSATAPSAPAMYACKFPPCSYRSKRESNCKQHMEKAHGWEYVRTRHSRARPRSASPDTGQSSYGPPPADAPLSAPASISPPPPVSTSGIVVTSPVIPPNAVADIVFVHGLGGDSSKTWNFKEAEILRSVDRQHEAYLTELNSLHSSIRSGSRSPDTSKSDKRTLKHPATFQCNFCHKSFTRAYNLRSHERTHEKASDGKGSHEPPISIGNLSEYWAASSSAAPGSPGALFDRKHLYTQHIQRMHSPPAPRRLSDTDVSAAKAVDPDEALRKRKVSLQAHPDDEDDQSLLMGMPRKGSAVDDKSTAEPVSKRPRLAQPPEEPVKGRYLAMEDMLENDKDKSSASSTKAASVEKDDELEEDVDFEEDMDEKHDDKSRGLKHSRGGVTLPRKRKKDYPSSWGIDKGQMTMKKRVMHAFEGPRRLAKDDLMLSVDKTVRTKLSGDYDADLDMQTMKRAEGFLDATDAEKGPWISDCPTEEQIREMEKRYGETMDRNLGGGSVGDSVGDLAEWSKALD